VAHHRSLHGQPTIVDVCEGKAAGVGVVWLFFFLLSEFVVSLWIGLIATRLLGSAQTPVRVLLFFCFFFFLCFILLGGHNQHPCDGCLGGRMVLCWL